MTVRIAFHSDPQFTDRGTTSLLDQLAVTSFIANEMGKRFVDLSLSGGDTWESARPSPAECEAVDAYVMEQASVCPFAVVYGNHDDRTHFDLLNNLRSKRRIVAATRPRVELLAGVAVAFFPYPSMASLRAYLAEKRPDWVPSIEQAGTIAREMMRDILAGLGIEMDAVAPEGSGIPRILLAHGMTDGGKSSTGQPIIGDELRIGLDDLGLVRAHFYAFGHLHNGALNEFTVAWPDGTLAPGCHAGSARRRDFGECEQKRFIVLTFEGSKLVGREDVPLPCPPMLHLSADWTGDEFGQMTGNVTEMQSALVRFRYVVPSDQQEAARRSAEQLATIWKSRGASFVKLDPVVDAPVRARAPEIAAAVGIDAKLRAKWARDGDVDDARAERLLALAGEVAR